MGWVMGSVTRQGLGWVKPQALGLGWVRVQGLARGWGWEAWGCRRSCWELQASAGNSDANIMSVDAQKTQPSVGSGGAMEIVGCMAVRLV
jgi:hypothetical protein